ncbi:AraC family transcriptional regulator [Prolixibacteraceae bacterium Z1-6]|uniref:AraC family transcriptional regulator n=1 Tax=Draconibacterium aestuarii TaxID=2998507 RepID=A0A9X3F3F9_9BACT|nr:AraC family transcriptional regulator [Prolixibacteraceae bacterium Z1-6]
MEKTVPKYYDPNKGLIYEADSCTPLRDAWLNQDLELTTLGRGTYPGKMLKDEELSGVKSIGYWDIKKLQNWGLEWHTNEGIEICLLESGTLGFQIKGSDYQLTTNNITITRPWISHRHGVPLANLSKLHWLILDVNVRHPHQKWQWPDWIILNPKDLEELTLYLRQNEHPVWKANAEFRNCFIQIGNVIKQSQTKPYDSKLKILINQLMVILLEIFKAESAELDQSLTESKRSVELFLNSVEDKLEEEWTVVKMAEDCRLGVTRFTHYCKEITNCSPMEYLNRLRLRKASKILVKNKKIPIIDVAFICGFSSNQYFNYAFKKHFKLSPNKYRKANQQTESFLNEYA